MQRTLCLWLVLMLLLPSTAWSEDKEEGPMTAGSFKGLAMRNLGPAVTSGRVADFAMHPTDAATYYVAVCSGNVWKTENNGTTYEPIFDNEGSYSIGCIRMDPHDPLTIWVGTGENNSQRSVSYGDGVYKSTDGGKNWKNMGLEDSQHIGMIQVDPRDSDVVYVAAQGPLWNAGGDRGLYKSYDGGENWELILEISEHTGVNEVHFDPRDPDVLYASSYQRRRRVWTLIDGGPESAIYKSNDAGVSWTKLENGIPSGDKGRIGLAVSPADPDVVYAIIEGTGDEGGFFRSTDAGGNWDKRSDYVASSPQYYHEIVADPLDVDRVYSLDTFMQVTEDGGKSFSRVGNSAKHVDDHALWIDPQNTDHLLAGCDGGIYESWERGRTWQFKANLPVTQFYRVSSDNDTPFYNVYGGTQDNNSLGAPSRSVSASGITNADWLFTLGGDGYETQVDPTNADIIYSQYQYGGLARYDRATGEALDIQPQPGANDPPLRWNWDSPVLLSPHLHTRLYFAANRLFRTDDRGDSWTAISPDLTRQLDRNQLEVMGIVQSVDAVAKSRSTSYFGNIVSLDESTLQAGLLYVGTDDGLIQVSDDDGGAWRRIEKFKGVPDMSYVSDVMASRHELDTVFASFDNHKNGDFKPYVLKSTDRGGSWKSIAGNLPGKGTVYTIEQDSERPDLLFVGTEYGVFFTIDGGRHWTQLKGGIPVIAVRDLDIQRRENDLVVGTFGRGIYILDDYTPLRHITPELLENEEGVLFPVKRSWIYMESTPRGGREKASLGDGFYFAPNPPYGAVFTYFLKDGLKTRKEQRQTVEKDAREADRTPSYPDWDELRSEDREEDPQIILTVRDANGKLVRRVSGPVGKGFHRVAWDLRYPPSRPASTTPWVRDSPWSTPPRGPLAAPGSYTVALSKRVDGVESALGAPKSFEAIPLGLATLPDPDWNELLSFQRECARLQRAVLSAVRVADDAQSRLAHIKVAVEDAPEADLAWRDEARAMELRLADLRIVLTGDRTIRSRNEPTPPSIVSRVDRVLEGAWESTSWPTQTHRDNVAIAQSQFGPVLSALTALVETELADLERRLEAAGAPWTPGRKLRWSN